jgi:hypothetical protein
MGEDGSMSDPMPGKPPVHNEHPSSLSGRVEHPVVQQHFIPAYALERTGQEDTPLTLRVSDSRVEGHLIFQGEEFKVKDIRISPGTARIQIFADKTVYAILAKKLTGLAEQSRRIEHPPATRYISMLKSVLTHGAYDRIIAPYVAQEQHEYYEALLQNDMRQAKVIRARMYLLLTWLSFRAFVSPVIRLITRAG